MTQVPTLAEMRHALNESAAPDGDAIPTLAEMMHANALYQSDQDAYLEHYGVKGMKWGVRRTASALGRLAGRGKAAAIGTKDEEGNVVGGIRAKSRAGAQKLKDMREGSTIILEDAAGATKVMSKQKDGTFKEVYLSADAERVLRTSKKAESELSDAEITAAINRSKKIEEYNKLFHPVNPNADLAARVQAMEFEVRLKAAEAALKPASKNRVEKFITTVENGFGAYNRMDKAMNNTLHPLVKQMFDDIRTDRANTGSSKTGDVFAARKAAKTAKQEAEDRFWGGGDKLRETAATTSASSANMSSAQQKRVDDYIYNITTMGQSDPNNPFYNPATPISPSPTLLELESRRD